MNRSWVSLADEGVKASPKGLWNKILDYIEGPIVLKIVANGEWTLDKSQNPAVKCGPDGNRSQWPTDAMMVTAPIGALIGKIGGGTAEKPVTTTPPQPTGNTLTFVVGTYCILALDNTVRGALFLAMNDSINSIANHDGEIQVRIDSGT